MVGKATEFAQEFLAEMGKELESSGFKVKSFIKTGFPWRKILDLEEAEATSILVIGSHGPTAVTCSWGMCPTG